MKRLLLAVAVTLGALTVSASPAAAYPSWCSTSHSSNVAAATCWGGSGYFRVVAVGWDAYYGWCAPVGSISRVWAPSNIWYAFWQAC
jgi:hypothetical protein